MFYLTIDGDRVGDRLERYILDENIEMANVLSKSITEAIDSIVKSLGEESHLLFKGGDSAIIILSELPNLDRLKTHLWSKPLTFSCGVSDSIRGAWMALKIAKVSRPSIVFYFNGDIEKHTLYG